MNASADPIMAEIMAAIAVLQSGDRSGARDQLGAIWARIANAAEPIHECTLSHYMADTQDDIADELAWDIRASNAALRSSDADAQRHSQALSIASARSSVSALPNDPYGQMIRRGIERFAQKLEAAGQ